MTYQVLARKWRPSDFAGIVGQDPIITALRNGLKENRVAQAYLFSGIRGVGKTTAARVLAKALNCENGPTPDHPAQDPCNECPSCREIASSKDLDVLEIDAATYSKVEQVRELTESLRYGPARNRYKVVVLDEVHRLSKQAFDALLKIVEEPPKHLVFIFATTESDAVPATIHSRCQEFQFRRVPSPVLSKHLKTISEVEQITISDAALRFIARAGDGSVRDSVALLDQLATFGNGTISDQDATNLLGGLDTEMYLGLLEAIFERNPSWISNLVKEIEATGTDPHNVYSQFLLYLRDAILLSLGGDPTTIDLPLEQAEDLAKLVQNYGYENILRLSHHLLASESNVRRSEFGMLALKLSWLRAAELQKLTQIEDILGGHQPIPTPTPNTETNHSKPAAVPGATPKPNSTSTPKTKQKDTYSTSYNEIPNETPRTTNRDNSTLDNNARVSNFLEQLGLRRQPLAALVETAQITIDESSLVIQPLSKDSLLPNALQRKNNASLVDELVRDILGPDASWSLIAPRTSRAPKEPTVQKTQKTAPGNTTVQAVIEVFGGQIQNVQKPEVEPP